MECSLKPLLLAFLFNITLIGCFEELGSSSDTISDETFYEQVTVTIIFCIADLYNQNLAGRPVGEQNVMASGPLGGSVTITGSTSLDQTHDITTTDLSYDLTAVRCIHTDEAGSDKWLIDLTMTGIVTEKGSFSDSFHSITIQSDAVKIFASTTYNGKVLRTLDETGPIVIHYQTNSVSADIFGHTVAWSWEN